MAAIEAMSADVYTRFRIDEKRVYTAGLSGGARVAMQVALGSGRIAGVIASSAGFPDSVPRKTAPFDVFGTAGTEDFNYLEMRLLDRSLTTSHHVAIFEGGHTWLSSELAMEAVEWMEIQAMKSGRSPRNDRSVPGAQLRRGCGDHSDVALAGFACTDGSQSAAAGCDRTCEGKGQDSRAGGRNHA